jgi:rhomboid protease GluP
VEPQSLADRIVETLAVLMDRIGLNGTRLRWRWRQRRQAESEAALERANRWRGVTARHKMCPACRGLVDAGAARCPECGEDLGGVSRPGPARAVQGLVPTVAPVTTLIITANVAIFVLMQMVAVTSGAGNGGPMDFLGVNPVTLWRFGMGHPYPVAVMGETWRILTPLFLHGGVFHLLFNMYVLMQIGRLLEDEIGGSRLWVIFLTAGVAGGLASNFLRPMLTGRQVPYVGASGAIFGLIGLAAVYAWRQRTRQGRALFSAMVTWIIYVTLFSLVGPLFGFYVDNFAHFGGLAGGALFGLFITGGAPRGPMARFWSLAGWLGVAAVVWAFYMAGAHGTEFLEAVGR